MIIVQPWNELREFSKSYYFGSHTMRIFEDFFCALWELSIREKKVNWTYVKQGLG